MLLVAAPCLDRLFGSCLAIRHGRVMRLGRFARVQTRCCVCVEETWSRKYAYLYRVVLMPVGIETPRGFGSSEEGTVRC